MDSKKDHKKRMRRNQKLRKDARLHEIFHLIASNASEFSSWSVEGGDSPDSVIAGFFKPIQNREEESARLWSMVPPVCSPHLSRLSQDLLSPHLLEVERNRQDKLRRKLERQVEAGAITEKDREEQLGRLDRASDSDSFQLLGADRGTRKKQQVENIASLLQLHNMEEFKVVVDFGSGSDILKKRAEEAGLKNILVKQFTFTSSNHDTFIEEISDQVGAMDLGIGLHSCGTFTDIVMEVCRETFPQCLVEFDRGKWAEERGGRVQYLRMDPASASPKHLVLYCQF